MDRFDRCDRFDGYFRLGRLDGPWFLATRYWILDAIAQRA